MFSSNEIYYDNELSIGVNAYFIWGHHFFKSYDDFEMFVYERFKSDFVLVEITNENYEELVLKGVFHGCY